MPTIPCPAGLAIRTDHDHGGVPRHVGDMSFCNHTPRPEGLPTEVMVGVTADGDTVVLGGGEQHATAWLTAPGGADRRVFRASLSYRSEITRIPPVPASTQERPVTWS